MGGQQVAPLPANKKDVLSILAHRVKVICDQENLHAELDFFQSTFCENGYSINQICQAPNPYQQHVRTPTEDPASMVFLPFIMSTLNHTSMVLFRHNIEKVYIPPKKVSNLICPMEGSRECECTRDNIYIYCRKVYIGLTSSTQTRVNELHHTFDSTHQRSQS